MTTKDKDNRKKPDLQGGRTAAILVRVSLEERSRIAYGAQQVGLSKASFLRMIALERYKEIQKEAA